MGAGWASAGPEQHRGTRTRVMEAGHTSGLRGDPKDPAAVGHVGCSELHILLRMTGLGPA